MLESFEFILNKDSFLSLLYVLYKRVFTPVFDNIRSVQLVYAKLIDVIEKLEFNEKETKYVSEYLDYIKKCM